MHKPLRFLPSFTDGVVPDDADEDDEDGLTWLELSGASSSESLKSTGISNK
jgi:hypothetical protein